MFNIPLSLQIEGLFGLPLPFVPVAEAGREVVVVTEKSFQVEEGEAGEPIGETTMRRRTSFIVTKQSSNGSSNGGKKRGSGSSSTNAPKPKAAITDYDNDNDGPGRSTLTWKQRVISVAVRVVLISAECFLAILIPFFGDLLGLVGAFSGLASNIW